MFRRNKSYPRQQMRQDFRNFVTLNRGHLLLVGGCFVVLVAAVSVGEFFLLSHGPVFWYVLGAAHGLLIALFVAMVTTMWITSSQPAIRYLRGTFGEDNTTDVLKPRSTDGHGGDRVVQFAWG